MKSDRLVCQWADAPKSCRCHLLRKGKAVMRGLLRFLERLDDRVAPSTFGHKVIIAGTLIVGLAVMIIYFARTRDFGAMVTAAIALLGIPIMLVHGRRNR